MLVKYWEKLRLVQENWRRELASMGVGETPARAAIEKVVDENSVALVSVYLFTRLSGEMGSLVVCHDLSRGAITFGANTQWGQWDEGYQCLTVDGTGEKFDFDGTPVSEGDDGACSLGNF